MHAACSSCSPLFARTHGPAHDSPLAPLLVVHARSHRATHVTPRPPRPPLLAVPLRACCPCTPSRRATRCCALSPSIPATINGEVHVLPVTLPCRPSPLSLSAYKQPPSRPSLRPRRPSTSPPLPRAAARRCCSPLPTTTNLRGQPSVDCLRTR
jgi:hypothetical protein